MVRVELPLKGRSPGDDVPCLSGCFMVVASPGARWCGRGYRSCCMHSCRPSVQSPFIVVTEQSNAVLRSCGRLEWQTHTSLPLAPSGRIGDLITHLHKSLSSHSTNFCFASLSNIPYIMRPHLPSKRRSESEHDRASKKGGRAEPTYDTYDDALDGGVNAEEKGERYKDGEKAQRFYEQAAELYGRALGFNDKSYDAAYNLGRVWYVLASQFYLPPASLDCYMNSVKMFQSALKLTEDPLCKNDAGFNLAQAMNATADVIEEWHGRDDASREHGKELREGALWLLNTVIQAQLTYVQGKQHLEEEKAKGEAAETKPSVDEPAASGDGMDVDQPASEEKVEKETKEVYPANEPTPDALVDTLLLAVDIGVTAWNYADPPAPPSDEQQEAIRGLLGVAREYGGDGRQAEVDLAECKVLLAVDGLMYDQLKDQITPGTTGLEENVGLAVKTLVGVLKSLDTQPADDASVRADILESLADTEMQHALRLQYFFHKGHTDPQRASTAWSQLSASATHLTEAAKLPVVFSTPKEFKPNLYLSLLRNTLARARLAPYNETAATNAQKLLDNCAAYAAKASDAVGWKFAKLPRENDPQPNPFFVEPLEVPFPAGWDMEMLARDTQLLMLRVCYFANSGVFGDKIDKDPYSGAATAILDGITSVSAGPRRLMPSDVKRIVSDLEDEEGTLSDGEKEYWTEITQRIKRHLPEEGMPMGQ